MYELVINLHMHTPYSDGHKSHKKIAQSAIESGLDALIVTDHNVWVNGPEGYYQDGEKKVLLLVGEEIHDQTRDPQKNHLLVFGAGRELATLAYDTQLLLDAVKQAGALAFIAHPVDPASPTFKEPNISWVDWDLEEFTGIELWNAMSEFKSLLRSKLHALFYAFNPTRIAHGPFKETLRIWDSQLATGRRVVAIGGSDAHAFPASLGPIHRTLFPYEFHFHAINTHLLTSEPLKGDEIEDRRIILDALRQGHAFIGYDLPAPSNGFRFTASGENGIVWMGEEISIARGITLQIKLPQRAECHLIKDGKVIKTWHNRETCTHITSVPGVYRVETYINYLGHHRGWIFSNPIYARNP